MDYKQALEAIRKLESGADLASAIESHVGKLDEKIYTVIGESRTARAKAQTLEESARSLAGLVGLDGDLDVAALDNKIRTALNDLKQLQTDKAALETRATEAESKAQAFERKTKISEIATKAGANAAVLERLLGDRLDDLSVDGEVVKLGDKPLKEAIGSDEGLKPFEVALFPSATPAPAPTPTPTPKLPGGSPKGENGKKDLLSVYAAKNFGGAKVLTKKEAVDG